MNNWDKYTTEDLVNILSDYSKDVRGFRDRNIDPTDREQLIAKLNSLDQYMEKMLSTKEGRNILRSEGWTIREFEQEDCWDQQEYDQDYYFQDY